MSDEKQPIEGLESDEDIEAHLLKESLAAATAGAAIFAGSASAGMYPPPSPAPSDAAAEIALIEAGRTAARGAKADKAAKKAVKAKKAKKSAGGGGGRHQPQ
ncbi:MAG: hypothetical protein WD689_04220 [Gaiellaceae bacterium]